MRRAALGLLVTVAVAGCGSSASGGSGTTTTAGANNRTQVAECLRKQGVTVPNRPAGATGPRGPASGGGPGFLFGGGQQQRPAANPKFQAAAHKCGLNLNTGNHRFSVASNPRFKQAINKFVTCVRKNGYDMPAPNLTGNGPVFDATKVNRNDPKFVKAATKCQSLLNFGGPTGPGGPAPPQ